MKIPSAILLAALAASPALARVDPTPPPSGVVIHLFGPNSVSSHILPANTGTADGRTAGAATQAAPASAPTLGGVLHQMFVTGDPNQTKPAAPPGRAGSF